MGRTLDDEHLGADDAGSQADQPPPYSATWGPPTGPGPAPPAFAEATAGTRAPAADTKAPAADVTAAFASLDLSNEPSELPTPGTCLAHLKLLYAFRALREEVGYTDGLWGIRDPNASWVGRQHPEVVQKVVSRLREKRWAVYLARAVDRYESWWAALDGRELTMEDMRVRGSEAYEAFPHGGAGSGMVWDATMLMPLGKEGIAQMWAPQ